MNLSSPLTVLYNSLFSRDVMYISKCKIAEPQSFQLSLAIEHPKYISFSRFSVR